MRAAWAACWEQVPWCGQDMNAGGTVSRLSLHSGLWRGMFGTRHRTLVPPHLSDPPASILLEAEALHVEVQTCE